MFVVNKKGILKGRGIPTSNTLVSKCKFVSRLDFAYDLVSLLLISIVYPVEKNIR